MLRLPFTEGMPNVALTPAGQRFAYDHAIRAAGCRIKEFDSRQQLEHELKSGTVALISILGDRDATAPIKLEDIAPAAKRSAVPILVDAASEFPQTPSPWLERGADLLVYSVGKFMRGPAASGLLLGKESLVRAAWTNAAPHQALGRAMKVSKEQMVGAVIALEEWFKRDPVRDEKAWLDRLSIIGSALAGLDGVETTLTCQPGRVPRLRLTWGRPLQSLDSGHLRESLLAGTPRVLIDDIGATANSVLIDPFNLTDAEARMVGVALREALAQSPEKSAIEPGDALASLAGAWRARIEYANGARMHRLQMEQDGARLSGEHTLSFAKASIEGHVSGSGFVLETTHRLEGLLVRFQFSGEATSPGRMEGRVAMGASSEHTKGPVAFGQFGQAKWIAVRE